MLGLVRDIVVQLCSEPVCLGMADKIKHDTVVRAPTTGTSIIESTVVVVVCRKREDLNAECRGRLVSGRKCIVLEKEQTRR